MFIVRVGEAGKNYEQLGPFASEHDAFEWARPRFPGQDIVVHPELPESVMPFHKVV